MSPLPHSGHRPVQLSPVIGTLPKVPLTSDFGKELKLAKNDDLEKLMLISFEIKESPDRLDIGRCKLLSFIDD